MLLKERHFRQNKMKKKMKAIYCFKIKNGTMTYNPAKNTKIIKQILIIQIVQQTWMMIFLYLLDM